jgi:excisionase family DNA binding protein
MKHVADNANTAATTAPVPIATRLVRRATMTVDETAVFLGISRGAAYAGVRSGEIPALRIGNRWLVPVQAVKEKFGLVDPWGDDA